MFYEEDSSYPRTCVWSHHTWLPPFTSANATWTIDNVSVSGIQVPEPQSLVQLGTPVLLLLLRLGRRKLKARGFSHKETQRSPAAPRAVQRGRVGY